ncbi:hypothetical protein KM043_018139 [Ampulex compressa]|nr:hypothetical protein KM043_018139 [Ampulex compressa]
MSESSKMGLFGSKDKNKDLKKESTKGDSPDRYAPYCIDSDSETYDTEALSIMDINDIIGVQSEPVSDSTLESEIAALSQIITETKAEGSHNTPEPQLETPCMDVLDNKEEAPVEELLMDDMNLTTEESKVSEESMSVSTTLNTVNLYDKELLSVVQPALVEQPSMCETANSSSDIKYDNSTNKNCKTDESVKCPLQTTDHELLEAYVSVSIKDTNMPSTEHSTPDTPAEDASQPIVLTETSENKQRKEVCNEQDERRDTTRVGVISDSLQLIGEAYTSEDSQETSGNDAEMKKETVTTTLNEDSIPSCKDKVQDNENSVKTGENEIDHCNRAKETDFSNPCVIDGKLNTEKNAALLNETQMKKIEHTNHLQLETMKISTASRDDAANENIENSVLPAAMEESKNIIPDRAIKVEDSDLKMCTSQTQLSKLQIIGEKMSLIKQEASEAKDKVAELLIEEGNSSNKEYTIGITNNQPSIIQMAVSETKVTVKESDVTLSTYKRLQKTGSLECEQEEVEEVVEQKNINRQANIDDEPMEVEGISINKVENVEDSKMDKIESDMDISESKDNISDCVVEQNKTSLDNTEMIEDKQESSVKSAIITEPQDPINASIDNNDKDPASSVSSDAAVTEKDTNTCDDITDMINMVAKIADNSNKENDDQKIQEGIDPELAKNITTVNSENPVQESISTEVQAQISQNQEKSEMSALCTSVDTEIIFKDTDKLKLVSLKEKKDDIAVASDTNTESCFAKNENLVIPEIETLSQIQDSSSEENNNMTSCELQETMDTDVQQTPNPENLPLDSTQRLTDVLEKMVEDTNKKPDVQDTSNIDHITEDPAKQIKSATLKESKTLNMNSQHFSHQNQDVLSEKDKESSSSMIMEKTQSTEKYLADSPVALESTTNKEETIMQTTIEENNKRSKIDEKGMEEDELKSSNVKTVTEQETDAKLVQRNIFSPTLDQADIVIPEEDAEEEGMDEEMNLTLDPEEPELPADLEPQSETNIGEAFERSDVVEDVRDITVNDQINIDIPVCTESKNTELENIAQESINNVNLGEASSSNDMVMCTLEKNDLMGKSDLEDNSKNESEDNNLNSILESAKNVVEMFSEEPCQNAQDIVTSILDDVTNATDFKNILGTEDGVGNEIEDVLQQSSDLPLVGTEIEELAKKLPDSSGDILNKDMEDSMSTQNIDSLEGLLGLDLMSESEDSTLKDAKTTEVEPSESTVSKDVGMALLLEQSNHASDMEQDTDYITDVISSCLTSAENVLLQNNTDKADIDEGIDDKAGKDEQDNLLKVNDSIIAKSINESASDRDIQKSLEVNNDLPENDLHMGYSGAPLESGDLEESEPKLELSQDILLGSVSQSDSVNDTAEMETLPQNSEISELESAVKFLQESEEQVIDSALILSPKMVESVVNDMSKQEDTASLFVPDEDICDDTSELVAELQDIATDSISISEAEIISEAAKLESERKLAEKVKSDTAIPEIISDSTKLNAEELKDIIPVENVPKIDDTANKEYDINFHKAVRQPNEDTSITMTSLTQNVLKISELIPKVSILEERLKEPPKIEIPMAEVPKVSMETAMSKDSLLIQKDSKIATYQKMLESPKLSDKNEPKIIETPRKDSEKHDFENVGSPRIILKIAKSAIADCGEQRSPKSPKIRSATNSPNPEDSPGQKLGKIKLKLSKSGHPSIISNENTDEVGQWHTEGTSSMSPIGMKIKLSKFGDPSIISADKQEIMEEPKETKHKFEESKRTESPIGMKIKLSKSGDASIVQQDPKEISTKHKDKLDIVQGSPKKTESPIGMKIKLSKTGDASIIQSDRTEISDEHKESMLKTCYGSPKRTDSPIGMKIKLSKTGDASIVSPELSEEGKEGPMKLKEKFDASPEIPKRTESPIGMKIKLAKTKGGASIISVENTEDGKERLDIPDIPKRTESPLGMKIKLSKTGDASIVHSELTEEPKDVKHKEKPDGLQDVAKPMDLACSMKIKVQKLGESSTIVQEPTKECESTQESSLKVESPIGMKIKLSKFGDASIVSTDKQEQAEEHKFHEFHQEPPKRTESPLGMKIKLSKSGDASIIQNEMTEDMAKVRAVEQEHPKAADPALGMKIKFLKTGDASIVEPERKEKQQRRRDGESPLEMKIKLSKTGHPTIIACDSHGEPAHKPKDNLEPPQTFGHRYKEPMSHKEPALKILKTGHSTILQSNRSELTIEPVQMQGKKMENVIEISPKRKEITISPIENKKSKLETQLSQILPEVTIQPVTSRDQKQLFFDPKTSLISRQQMNVISQEISITQVRPTKADGSMSDKFKDMMCKNVSASPLNSDCEIIEHRPELIIVNENSNSSQDVVIIEEVPPIRMPEVKIPKKRGRPRRNPLPQQIPHPASQLLIPKDPLALNEIPQVVPFEHRENERPKRTCRNQKSYAPPRRGRGRGRGKRKLDSGVDMHMGKKPRIEQDLSAIEASTMAVLTLNEHTVQQDALRKSSELYKALKQPPMDSKDMGVCKIEKQSSVNSRKEMSGAPSDTAVIQFDRAKAQNTPDELSKIMPKPLTGSISLDTTKDKKLLTEAEKMQKAMGKSSLEDKTTDKVNDGSKQVSENKDILVPPGHPNWLTPISKRQSDTTARHETMSTVQVIDEETRMSAESGSRSQTPARNISMPASETLVNEESQVDKIAEYEWPLDRKGETFMIQEQISQYLGVKSFKRKYPDLKRRMVDMEERNYLRENGLVSEAMCDMGLTAVCSSEVLDVMCSDFPDQYEEYRKHMREKQVKEHSKKQKELTAAANAEKNRIDLAEMAVQSALSWNVTLNKARKENRKCSLDLQTFTIHVPKKQQKVEVERKVSHYPVALIPGQYTDYYREYTAAELRYYPLNTVLYGPMRPNERKFDSQSEGSQSDSDSDSSSDDSSSTSSEGTQDTEGSQSTMDDVDMEIATQKDELKLKCKMCLKTLNKHSKNDVLIQCGTCNGNVHPSCIDLTLDMVPHIQSYSWQCTDCKTCAQCHDPADEDKMLFCDMCDRGYHIYCVGLRRVPQGRWHCQECAVCANCGSRDPGGPNSDRNGVAQWQHEHKKGDKNTRVYVSTLCLPCSKLRGNQGSVIRQEKLPV